MFPARRDAAAILATVIPRASFGCLVLVLVLVACGCKAVWDPPVGDAGGGGAGGGAGGAGGSTTQSSVTSTAVTVVSSSSATGGAGAGGEAAGGGPTESGLEEISLGVVASDVPTPITIAGDTLGFTVLVKSSDPYGRMGVRRLESPSAAAVVDEYGIAGTAAEFSWYGMTPAGVPQSDQASAMPTVMPGTWQLTVGDPTAQEQSAAVSLWRRRTLDGLFHGGALDVNVFAVDGVTTTTYVQQVLKEAFGDWAGIGLGNVAFYPLASTHALVDESTFFQLVQQSSAATNTPSLNLFVIEAFTGELSNVIGVAAGIPGLGIAPGSNSSGIVWMPSGALVDASVLRHEAGHLAGLFHTTEIAPGYSDPLGDTAVCRSVEMLVDACPDAGNVMFPYALGAAGFSTMQARVIRGSTLYRGFADEVGANAAATPGGDAKGERATPHEPLDEDALGADGEAVPGGVARSSWRARLGRGASFATAHWCSRNRGRGADAARLAKMVAARDLVLVAFDERAPELVRERAVHALATTRRPHRAALTRLANDASTARRVRLAALDALLSVDARPDSTGAMLARTFAADGDPAMARYARRLLARRGF